MAVNSGQRKETYLTKLTDTSTTDVEGVGAIRMKNGKRYKWVLFNNGTGNVASVVGGVAGYLQTDTDFRTVTSDTADAVAGVGAGVFMAVIADASYGWIQTGGLTAALSVDVTGTTPAIKDAINLSATDLAFKVDPGADEMPCGILMDVTASANLVYLDCMD